MDLPLLSLSRQRASPIAILSCRSTSDLSTSLYVLCTTECAPPTPTFNPVPTSCNALIALGIGRRSSFTLKSAVVSFALNKSFSNVHHHFRTASNAGFLPNPHILTLSVGASELSNVSSMILNLSPVSCTVPGWVEVTDPGIGAIANRTVSFLTGETSAFTKLRQNSSLSGLAGD